MSERIAQENKMGYMPVPKLLMNMGIPMMVSMLVQALYNVVDGIFVSYISEDALTAVSMAFPLQNLIIAFAVGNGVGMNALLSRALGSRDMERVKKAALHGLFLQIISYIIFLFVGIFFAPTYMHAQTSDPVIFEYGVTYLRIVMCLSLGVFIEISYERFLQATGRTKYSMYTQLCGAVFNIVFDPILIFGLLGFPAMGIAGAAAATVAGQIFGCFVGYFLNKKKNPEISMSFKGFRPEWQIIGEICRVSIPSIMMSAIFSVTVFCMDIILRGFSSTAVAVLGVYFKLQSFFMMPVFGLNNAIVPIIAFNYGADMPERIRDTLKYGIIYASCFLLFGLLLMQTVPDLLLSLFNADGNMLNIGMLALRFISLQFIFAGFNIVSSSACQAFGQGLYSLIISALRQLIILLPVAWLISLGGVLDYIWLAFPIAETSAVLISFLLLRHVIKKSGMDLRKRKTV